MGSGAIADAAAAAGGGAKADLMPLPDEAALARTTATMTGQVAPAIGGVDQTRNATAGASADSRQAAQGGLE